MSLNVTAGMLKIDGDTSGANKALDETKKKSGELQKDTNDLGTSFLMTAAKMSPVAIAVASMAAALKFAKGAYDDFNKAQKESADLFSQFSNLGFGGAKLATEIQNAADGMIKIETSARSMNILMRSEIAATVDEVQSLAKASVEIARKMGGSADDIMNALTLAVSSGKTEGLLQYGIRINTATVEIDAHIDALEKFGQAANVSDIKLMKSKTILNEIHGIWKDSVITAGDVNEIEAKSTNERSRNMALSAKYSEESAKKIQQVKLAWRDANDSAKGYFNGIEANTKKVMSRLGPDAKRQIQDFQVEFFGALEATFGKAVEGLSTHDHFEIFTRQAAMSVDELGKSIEFQFKTQKAMSQEELKILDQKVFKELKRNESLEEQARLALAFAKDKHGADSQEARDGEVLLLALEKRGKSLETINEKIADQRAYRVAQDGLMQVDKIIKETAEYQVANTLKLSDYRKMDAEQLKNAAKKSGEQTAQIKKMIDYYATIAKLGNGLTLEQESHLSVLKDQNKEIEIQQGLMTKVMKLLFGGKPEKPVSSEKDTIAAWEKELDSIQKALKKGLGEEIELKYGTVDIAAIESQLKAKADVQIQFETELSQNLVKIKETEKLAIAAGEESQRVKEREATEKRHREILESNQIEIKEMADKVRALINPQVDYQRKIDELFDKTKKTRAQALKAEISDLSKQIIAITDAQAALAAKKAELVSMDTMSVEQEAELKKQSEDLLAKEFGIRKDYKDKTIELKKEENAELTALQKKMGDDMKKFGTDLLNSTGGAMWDAMNISNKALEESGMSRSEMQKKALQDTLRNISKEAFMKALWEDASALASLAVGDAAGFALHGAAATAYGAISGVAYAASKAVGAPGESEMENRMEAKAAAKKAKEKEEKEKKDGIKNSSASVAGASSGGTKVINIYWPQGMFIGDKDDIVKFIRVAEDEADRRGK